MREYTVKEFAAIERVTPRTVHTWIAKGAIEVRRTPGGGLRIIVRGESSRVTFLGIRSDAVSG